MWGNKEHPVLGGLVSSSCSFRSWKEGDPQLHALLLPSGKILVLQAMGLDDTAKGSELEDASRECYLVFSDPVLQMP